MRLPTLLLLALLASPPAATADAPAAWTPAVDCASARLQLLESLRPVVDPAADATTPADADPATVQFLVSADAPAGVDPVSADGQVIRVAAAVLADETQGAALFATALERQLARRTDGACAATTPIARAEAFMQAYGAELAAGDREAVLARYHPDGAWFLGDGGKTLASFADIAARYRGRWRPPLRFAWHDLSYEPAGPGAVVVLGRFEWQSADDAAPGLYSYSALLVDVDGTLRIRVEDESR